MSNDRNPVGWFEIYVQDMERAKKFYQDTLQVKLERIESTEHEMWMFPMFHEKSGCTGALIKMDGKDSGGGGTIIYFVCDDCSVEADRAAKNGGKLEKPKFSLGQYGHIAFVIDTEGNRIGLHSMQ